MDSPVVNKAYASAMTVNLVVMKSFVMLKDFAKHPQAAQIIQPVQKISFVTAIRGNAY